MTTVNSARTHPSRWNRARVLRPDELPVVQAIVDYRLGRFGGWTATLRSDEERFSSRSVHAPDAEGIFLGVLGALDELRVETGRLIESDHVVHDGFAEGRL